MQIAFQTTGPLLADKFPVLVGGELYELYVHSYLHYGQTFTRKWILDHIAHESPSNDILECPCLLKGRFLKVVIYRLEQYKVRNGTLRYSVLQHSSKLLALVRNRCKKSFKHLQLLARQSCNLLIIKIFWKPLQEILLIILWRTTGLSTSQEVGMLLPVRVYLRSLSMKQSLRSVFRSPVP